MGGSLVIRGLQERAARAMPAEHVTESGGWWLRHAPSCSWWIGSVLPHGDAVRDGELERRVAEAEAFYAANGAAARFQITPGACPEGLDDLLAVRGYERRSPVSLRTAPTGRVRAEARDVALDDRPATARVRERDVALDDRPATACVLERDGALRLRLDDRPAPEWFDVWREVNGGDVRSESDLLERVDRPSVYARAYMGDDVVAVGRAVEDGGWAGVFGMATFAEARGKGAGRAVLAALAGWAAARGVAHMYLQVEQDNPPALGLYERMGFAELCGYHYRIAE